METFWLSGVQIGELIYFIKKKQSKQAIFTLNKIALNQQIKKD